VPAPASISLAVFNDPPVAHAPRVTTSHSSVDATTPPGLLPPKAKVAVLLPLAEFISLASIQIIYFCPTCTIPTILLAPVGAVEAPPKAKAAV
jgi:hypothetical protein